MKKVLVVLMAFLLTFTVACTNETKKEIDFEPNYLLTFMLNETEVLSQQEVKIGSTINFPSEPTKEGYRFIGWFNGNEKFESTVVSIDALTLFAHFESTLKSYPVSFYDGEKLVYSGSYEEKTYISLDSKLEHKEGYEFEGWFLEPTFEILIKLDEIYVTESYTFYGKWIPIVHTVNFYYDNALFDTYSINNGQTLPTVDTTIEGYTFKGWFLDPLFITPFNASNPVTKSFDVFGKWEKNAVIDPVNPGNYTGYYASLNGLTGNNLKSALTSLVKSKTKATGSTNQVKEADKWQGQTYNIYTGLGSYGNREHVWPNSKLGSAPDYDLHNLRAAVVSVNSTRSNYPFGTGSGSWKLTSGKFYPGDEHVGDVARIVLYISLRYNLDLNLVGNLDMFLRWHEQDPVNEFELTRNGRIQQVQDSRNPFIDHPELVTVVYGKAKVSSSTVSVPTYFLNPQGSSFNSIFIQ